jgi:hypothetical protein
MTIDPASVTPAPVTPPVTPPPAPPSVSDVDTYWSTLLLSKQDAIHAAQADLDATVAAARAAGLSWLKVASILTKHRP